MGLVLKTVLDCLIQSVDQGEIGRGGVVSDQSKAIANAHAGGQ
jgi:hypothetical protein